MATTVPFGSLTSNRAYIKSGDQGMNFLGNLGKIKFTNVSDSIVKTPMDPDFLTNLKEEGGVEVLS